MLEYDWLIDWLTDWLIEYASLENNYLWNYLVHEIFVGSSFREFRGIFIDLRKLNPVKTNPLDPKAFSKKTTL